MTVDAWLAAALADAERRGLAALAPLLTTLGKATAALRAAEERMTEEERKKEEGGRKKPEDTEAPR